MTAIAFAPAEPRGSQPDAMALQMEQCRRQWHAALQAHDRAQLKALRTRLIAEGRQAERHLALPGMREQWLAWLQLRCALVIPRSRF